jgi:hypothetical protein
MFNANCRRRTHRQLVAGAADASALSLMRPCLSDRRLSSSANSGPRADLRDRSTDCHIGNAAQTPPPKLRDRPDI